MMTFRSPTLRRAGVAAAASLVLLPAIAAVTTTPVPMAPSSRALAAWTAPEPMDYGVAMTPRRVAWTAPEPMDYGVGAYATLTQFERGGAPSTAVAAR